MEKIKAVMARLQVRPWFPDREPRMNVEDVAKGLGLPSKLPVLVAIERNIEDMQPVLEGEGTWWIPESGVYRLICRIETAEALQLTEEIAIAMTGNKEVRKRTRELFESLGAKLVVVEAPKKKR